MKEGRGHPHMMHLPIMSFPPVFLFVTFYKQKFRRFNKFVQKRANVFRIIILLLFFLLFFDLCNHYAIACFIRILSPNSASPYLYLYLFPDPNASHNCIFLFLGDIQYEFAESNRLALLPRSCFINFHCQTRPVRYTSQLLSSCNQTFI